MKLRSWWSAAILVVVVNAILVVTFWPRAGEQEVGTVDPPVGSDDPTPRGSDDSTTEASPDAEVPEPGPVSGASSKPLTLSGEVREIGSVSEWEAAVASAQPGDELRLVSNINDVLRYRGDLGAPSGTPDNPIVITAEPGVWIDPGDTDNNTAALDVSSVRHVWVHGVQVRGSQFGIRFRDAGGSSEAPAKIQNSVVTNIGDACVHLGADSDGWQVSSYVIVESNDISGCGSVNPRFGEGVYIGYGKTNWIDETHDITVRNNRIHNLGSEAVDIKTGSRNIIVEDNLIHDVGGIRGGVITAHYALDPNPKPDELDLVVIRRNRIWNVNLDNRSESNDWAIWVGHGGIQVTENRIWNLRDVSGARAVRVRAEADFGPHQITISDNILWARVGWESTGSPSGSHLVDAGGNAGPAGSGGVEETFEPDVSVEGEARSSAEAAPGSAFDPFFGSPSGPSEPVPPPVSTTSAPPVSTTPPVPETSAPPVSTTPPVSSAPVSTTSAPPVSTTTVPPVSTTPPVPEASAPPVSSAPVPPPVPERSSPSVGSDSDRLVGSPPVSSAPVPPPVSERSSPSVGSDSDRLVGSPPVSSAPVPPVAEGATSSAGVGSTSSTPGAGSSDGESAAAGAASEPTSPAPQETTPSTGPTSPPGLDLPFLAPEAVGSDAGSAAERAATERTPAVAEGTTSSTEGGLPQSASGAGGPDGSVADDSALAELDHREERDSTAGVSFVTITIVVIASLAAAAPAATARMRQRG